MTNYSAILNLLNVLRSALFSSKNNDKENAPLLQDALEKAVPSPSPYELPVASAETLGGIKVGANLSINEEGVLSAPSPSGTVYIGTLDASPDASGKYRFYADDDFEDAFILDVRRKIANGIPVVLCAVDGEGGPRTYETVFLASYNEGDLRIETEHWFARN